MKKIEYKVGQKMNFPQIGKCTIQRVHDFGTVDVEDSRGEWFRVTGLPMFDLKS